MDQVLHWVDQYGYIILFLSLCLELIALPVPTEVLMAYVGFLSYQHQMNGVLSVFVAAFGSFAGMTIAYWIGFKLGYPFFQRHGHRFHLGPERLEKVSGTFNRHGTKFLVVSYFIPGVRHLTGYFSGITRIRYRSFAFFSGIGAIIWTGTFITLGELMGPKWQLIETSAKKYMVLLIVLLIIAGLVVYLVKTNLDNIKKGILTGAVAIFSTFQSRRRLKLLITAAAAIFIVFVSFSIGLMQDFVGRDFGDFNHTVLLISGSIFQEEWGDVIQSFLYLSNYWFLAGVAVLIALWILAKGKNRWLEFRMLLLLVGGGIVYVKILDFLFSRVMVWLRLPPTLLPSFRGDELVMTVLVYGFFAFLLSRHVSSYRIKIFATLLVLLILFVVGVGHLYFDMQLPSDIAAGYVFGGVWLSFIVLILEVFRLIRMNYEAESG